MGGSLLAKKESCFSHSGQLKYIVPELFSNLLIINMIFFPLRALVPDHFVRVKRQVLVAQPANVGNRNPIKRYCEIAIGAFKSHLLAFVLTLARNEERLHELLPPPQICDRTLLFPGLPSNRLCQVMALNILDSGTENGL
jgi:hypothetical protein